MLVYCICYWLPFTSRWRHVEVFDNKRANIFLMWTKELSWYFSAKSKYPQHVVIKTQLVLLRKTQLSIYWPLLICLPGAIFEFLSFYQLFCQKNISATVYKAFIGSAFVRFITDYKLFICSVQAAMHQISNATALMFNHPKRILH